MLLQSINIHYCQTASLSKCWHSLTPSNTLFATFNLEKHRGEDFFPLIWTPSLAPAFYSSFAFSSVSVFHSVWRINHCLERFNHSYLKFDSKTVYLLLHKDSRLDLQWLLCGFSSSHIVTSKNTKRYVSFSSTYIIMNCNLEVWDLMCVLRGFFK